MKNQIDQSTPFLAFYDLLRIRGVYSDPDRRRNLFRGVRRAVALAAVFVGLVLPQTARALPGGLAGDSRVTVSGSTMTIHPNEGAQAGSHFSWDSFNVADTETVTIDATSIHTAPSFDVAGLVDAGNNILVFKTPGGNIAVSGTIRAGRFFAATFGSFDYEDMSFKASDVASGEIDITGTIPGGSVLVGHTIAASGAAGTVVGTSGMDAESEITIASGGGTITFKGVMGDTSVLKAGTVNFEDVDADTKSTANGTVDAGDEGTVSGSFTQTGGNVNAGTVGVSGNEITQESGTLTAKNTINSSVAQNQAEGKTAAIHAATINGSVQQTAGTINTKTISGTVTQNGGTIQAANAADGLTFSSAITTQNGTLSGNGGNVTVADGSTLSGTVDAATLSGNFTQGGGTISAKTVSGTVVQNAGTIQAANAADGLTLSSAITTQKGTLSGNGGNVTVADGSTLSGSVSARNLTAGTGNITQNAGTIAVTETLTAGTFTQSQTENAAAPTASAATIAANVAQTGAGKITASTSIGTSGNDKTVSQTGAGEIKTDHVYGMVSQTGDGAAKLWANGSTLVLDGDVEQNNANATIGTTSTGVQAKQGFTQIDGKVEASTLTLDNAGNDYTFSSTGNNVATLSGTAKSVSLDNGANALDIKGVTTTDGLAITSAGAVTDSGTGVSGGSVKVDASTAITLDDTAALTTAGLVSSGNISITAGTSFTQSGAVSSTGGNVGVSTASFTQNGNAVSGKNVTILGTGDGGITIDGNVTATAAATGDGDILVKSTSGNVTTTAAAKLESTKGSVVLQGKNVAVNGTIINAKTAGEGVGIEALDSSDTSDPTKGIVTIDGNAEITSGKVVLVAPGDLTVESGVAMGEASAGDKDADLTVLTENALKMGLDEGTRPTKNVRIAGAKSMDADLNQEITLAQFAINAESLPELTFSEATERISIESSGVVKLTTKSDVTIFNNAGDGASASVEAKNVVDSADDPVKVQAGVPEDKAAHGLVGKTIDMTAGGAVTVEAGAIVSVSEGDLVLATPDGKGFTIQNGAFVQSKDGDVKLTSGGAMTANGRIVSGTVDVGQDQTVMNGTATTIGAVTLTAKTDVTVGKTGKVEGKDNVTIASNTGDVNFLGAAVSTDGDIVMSATADGKSVKIGDAGSTAEPVSPAVAAVVRAGNDVVLTGGRGVLAQGGSEITAANAVSATAKEFIASGADIKGAGKVTLTTTDAQTLAVAAGGSQAGDPAGILVQGGTIQSTADAVEMTAAGSVLVGNGATVTAKTTLDITSNGESDGTTEQGVRLAGTVSAEGKGTVTAEKGSIEQTDGSLATGALDLKARDIDQTGGSVTATGEATAEATAGSVTLARAGNDFQNGLRVTAEKNVNIRDANALAVSVAGETSGNVRLRSGTTLDVTSDIDAGGTATLLSGGRMNAQSVKAAGAVQATANSGGATFAGDVAGTSVRLVATGDALVAERQVTANAGNATLNANSIRSSGMVKASGAVTATAADGAVFEADVTAGTSATLNAGTGTLKTGSVTASGGSATLSGGVVTTGGDVTATGANSDASIAATAGRVTTGGKVTAGRDATITATTGANTKDGTVRAARNVTIEAGGTAQVADVTATRGNVKVSGRSVASSGDVKASRGNVVLLGGTRGTTVGGNVTAGKSAVVVADRGTATINEGKTVKAANLGVEAAKIVNDGTYDVNGALALVQTGNQAMTLTDADLPAGEQTVGIRSAGDITVNSAHDLTFGNASVTAGGRRVAANGIDSTAGAVNVTSAGSITSSAITGTGGTTITTENGGAITVQGGNIGRGGATTINANGATVAAAALVSGGALDVNNAGAVTANINAGGAATIDAASLESGNTAAASLTFDNVAGQANVGTLNVGGDMSGTVGGLFTTSGGQVGSIGQQGGFNANGGVQQNGLLTVNGAMTLNAAGSPYEQNGVLNVNGGEMTVTAGSYAMNGNLNADGAAVTINAPGGIQGAGNELQAGTADLNAPGGAIDLGVLNVGGAATIEAGSYTAGNTAAGSLAFDNVGGAADVGTLNVNGDMSGTVGQFATAGGTVGSIGQQGGAFQVNGDVLQNDDLTVNGAMTLNANGAYTQGGALNVGAMTVTAGSYAMNGNLNAGGAAVNINAPGGIQGGGTLTAGALTLAGGDIGAPGNNFQVVTPNLQNITGGAIYLTDTTGQQITIGTISAQNGELVLTLNSAAGSVRGAGTGLTSNGNMTITVTGPFGSLEFPISITVNGGGTLRIDGTGIAEGLLHFVMQGDNVPDPLFYTGEGFAVWDNGNGKQIVGAGPSKQRLINRALAFTVNTPELKSKQGIFGDPAFIHTKMNVSEARSAANMDILSLNAVDFYDTWEHVQSGEGRRALRKWAPRVDMGPNSLLMAKLGAQASEMETQPEVWVPGQTGAPSQAPAAPAAE